MKRATLWTLVWKLNSGYLLVVLVSYTIINPLRISIQNLHWKEMIHKTLKSHNRIKKALPNLSYWNVLKKQPIVHPKTHHNNWKRNKSTKKIRWRCVVPATTFTEPFKSFDWQGLPKKKFVKLINIKIIDLS